MGQRFVFCLYFLACLRIVADDRPAAALAHPADCSTSRVVIGLAAEMPRKSTPLPGAMLSYSALYTSFRQ